MFLLRWLSHLPFWALYRLSDLLAFVLDRMLHYRREVIDRNLATAFPEMTDAERSRVKRGFYRNLGDIIVETIKTISIPEPEIQSKLVVTGVETIEELARRGGSIMFLGSHQANWEWLFIGGSTRSPIRIDGIYKPLSSKKFDELLLGIRSRFSQGIPIEADKIVRNIAKHRGETRGIALLGDQRPHPRTPKIWAELFGQETAFFQGADLLPRLADAPVVICLVKRTSRGHYHVDLKKIAEPPYENDATPRIIDLYAAEVEAMIRDAPSDWLWSHDRWKYARGETDPLLDKE